MSYGTDCSSRSHLLAKLLRFDDSMIIQNFPVSFPRDHIAVAIFNNNKWVMIMRLLLLQPQ